ncbi:ABC transporter permease [Spirosoma koreense]
MNRTNKPYSGRQLAPPRWAERLLTRLTASHLRDEVLGDLYELFQRRVQRYGVTQARLLYGLETLLLLHPRLWRKQAQPSYVRSKPTNYSPPNPMVMLSNDVKIAFRKLSKHKTYTLINLVSLSLGIGCAILIFTLITYHLSFDTFHPNQERIYRITTELHTQKVTYSTGVPNPMGEAFRKGYDVADQVGRIAFLNDRVVTVTPQKKFEEDLAFADPEFLAMFNFPLLRGNLQTALQERNTALITERIAKQYFGDEDPVGQLLHIDALVVKITGILANLPPNTYFHSQIYLPFSNLQDHSPWMVEKDWWLGFNKEMQCFIRLKPGVSADLVNSSILPAISAKYYDQANARQFRFKLQPLADIHFNPKLRGQTDKKNLWTFGLIGFFLVLTACVNFINLATAQALGRSREIGVRKALGSERGAVFWQFITETALLAGLALVIALGLAYLALPVVNQWFELQLVLHPFTDPALLSFLAGLLLIVIFCSGAYPGLILARFQPVLALKGGLSQRAVGGFSLRKGLVVAQFAISQLLIIGTLIITHQLRYSEQADLGFRKEAIVILPVPDNKTAKLNTLRAQFSELSGVENVTFFNSPPASEAIGSTTFLFDSRPKAEDFSIATKSGDHHYIPAFNIPILAGRNLNPSDTIREYLLNETAVKALGLASPKAVIGKSATINNRPGTIVGVMKDFHFKSFHVAIEPLCLTTWGEVYGSCGVKVNPATLGPTLVGLEKAWKAMYPASMFSYRFLDEDIERFYKLDTILLLLIQGFAGIAIFVGCLGLYGLVSFMAAQKTKEIGVRKVLGASTGSILWLFGKEFFQLLLLAFLVAAPLAWWAMKEWLAGFVYRIEPGAGIFILAILITFLVALLTVGFRSVKAALMNPVKTLRTE